MFTFRHSCRIACAGSALALASLSSYAEPVQFIGMQGPKTNLLSNVVPQFNQAIQSAQAAFNNNLTVLGTNTLEGRQLSTDYTDGRATIGGGDAALAPNANGIFDPSLGRYNVTVPVEPDPNTGETGVGNWLEATSTFTLTLGTAINAFSFAVTDLGDYDGIFEISFELNGVEQIKRRLMNQVGSETDPTDFNGNLLFYGIQADFNFDKVIFSITQVPRGPGNPADRDTDVLGFDNFVFGRHGNTGGNVPEPTSLALVALALAGLGAAGAKRRRA